MEKPFEIGEILIFQNSTQLQKYNGEDCLLTGGWEKRQCGIQVGGVIEVDDMDCYRIEFEDGMTCNCQPHNLRRKKPPTKDNSVTRKTEKPKEEVQ